ncbi:MAG: SpoIIE family protein phosphatase [Gemmataceae bacterium]
MSAPELTVRQVMQPDPVSISPTTLVQDAMTLMNDRRIGALLVFDDPAALLGIFSERDLLRRVVSALEGWRGYPVSEWMTKHPHTINPDANWDEAVDMMARLRVRHLPVIEEGRVIGLISNRSLMVTRAEYLNRKIEERTRALKNANDQLLSREAESVRNLRAAGRLHRELVLPKSPPDLRQLRWAIRYAPLDQLGGDYYDFAEPARDHIGMLIADASGHSIPAALLAVMASVGFNDVADRFSSPGTVLTHLNRRLVGLSEERFVSAFYGVFDQNSDTLRYATAGHPPPLHIIAKTGEVKPLSGRGFLLGIMPEEEFRESEVPLDPGDKLCLYTDGVTESRNEIGELFGQDRLTACLERHATLDANELADRILEDLKAFCGTEPRADDVTLLIMELKSNPT